MPTLAQSCVAASTLPVVHAPLRSRSAIGFGAQSLVKDYFTGFFILLENQLTTGDVVEIAGKAGLVEDVTLRFVRLRDYGGNVHYVPNNLITTVTNMSRGYAHSVIDVGIAYREDVDQAFAVMRAVGGEMRGDADFGGESGPRPGGGGGARPSGGGSGGGGATSGGAPKRSNPDDLDDDIPF